jgi:hypothetical protein
MTSFDRSGKRSANPKPDGVSSFRRPQRRFAACLNARVLDYVSFREFRRPALPGTRFQFSDKVAGLETLFEGPFTFDLEDRIVAAFSGRLVPIEKLEEFALLGSPFAPEHLRKPTLNRCRAVG